MSRVVRQWGVTGKANIMAMAPSLVLDIDVVQYFEVLSMINSKIYSVMTYLT